MKSAVLLVVFRRPDSTSRVFEAIRAARPARLYVAADGPRADRPDDLDPCAATRQIVENVDWPCDVFRLYRDSNIGLRRNISEAIATMLEHEGEGIILEDDTLPTQAFFAYCDELLARYRDDERVGVISGYNPAMSSRLAADQHYFSELPMIWGWATWQRAWQGNEETFASWPGDTTGFPDSVMRTYGAPAKWIDNFERVRSGSLGSVWSYPFFFHCWAKNLLTAIPGKTLTVNIGYDADATNTVTLPPKHVRELELIEQAPPLAGPSAIEASTALDAAILSSYYKLGKAAALRQALVPVRNAILRTGRATG